MIPIGAGVRLNGRLGRVVRSSPSVRGLLTVEFPGGGVETARRSDTAYIAKEYRSAVKWDAAEAAGQIHNKMGKKRE